MSYARSPRLVCSTTIGIRVLCSWFIVLPVSQLQFLSRCIDGSMNNFKRPNEYPRFINRLLCTDPSFGLQKIQSFSVTDLRSESLYSGISRKHFLYFFLRPVCFSRNLFDFRLYLLLRDVNVFLLSNVFQYQ